MPHSFCIQGGDHTDRRWTAIQSARHGRCVHLVDRQLLDHGGRLQDVHDDNGTLGQRTLNNCICTCILWFVWLYILPVTAFVKYIMHIRFILHVIYATSVCCNKKRLKKQVSLIDCLRLLRLANVRNVFVLFVICVSIRKYEFRQHICESVLSSSANGFDWLTGFDCQPTERRHALVKLVWHGCLLYLPSYRLLLPLRLCMYDICIRSAFT